MKKERFSKEWRFLILANLLIAIFGFWINYSQIEYIARILERNLPISIPTPYPQTPLVIPGTGAFILIDSSIVLGTFLAIVFILIFLYFIYKK
ncbi:MAG: hypothetical protein QMD12_01735 [Candidatus Aenigmarchaeota archaeon]|nr:hypothetical protein [Candidatus Aenigmarchaeota archaeon]